MHDLSNILQNIIIESFGNASLQFHINLIRCKMLVKQFKQVWYGTRYPDDTLMENQSSMFPKSGEKTTRQYQTRVSETDTTYGIGGTMMFVKNWQNL